jgi:glycosyltransferase involved in cell wall biosynthesis
MKNEHNWDLIVFSHLRWEFVTQRPQHLMGRFAKNHKVLFIEEPIPFDKTNRGTTHIIRPENNVTVVQPRIENGNMQELSGVVKKEMQNEGIKDCIYWFYSGMFVDVLSYLDVCKGIIFDCMDELSAFKGAPQELIDKEKLLISKADVVFTGGKSLYESKKRFHSDVFCFPSSVDRKHFEKALTGSVDVPQDLESIPHPIVGFYGVIDERMDLELMKQTAELMPDVHFVYIGPVVKIAENDLPKRDNIHYLGSKKYEELPSYLKGIDIAFMPFALNKSTEFISPTKTLEFMAALKPIISTAIKDVERDYSDIVPIIHNGQEAKNAIQQFIDETHEQRQKRETEETTIVDKTSWDKTQQEMETIITNSIFNT